MAFYFWHQPNSTAPWVLGLDDDRQRIVDTIKPELATVLACDNNFENDLTREQLDKVKYRPKCVYFDFDAADIAEATQQAQLFLTNLKAKGLDLDTVKLFCSGSKGYHVEFGAETVVGKLPVNGIPYYPQILKEFAHKLYVETLDLRVYSAKRGRMWRQPNVQRTNGQYKVQITVAELMAMTPERYVEVCSSPRPLFPVAPPVYAPELGLIYSTARDMVEHAFKQRAKRKPQPDALKRFGGQWPETIQLILTGGGLKEEAGFNHIAMQLAIVAGALGKTEEQLLTDATGLIESHQGDGDRYGTPKKRREALREMYRYMSDNPSFEYDVAPVLALCIPVIARNSDLTWGDYKPDPEDQPKRTKTVQQTVVEVDQTTGEEVEKTVDVEVEADESDDAEEEEEEDASAIKISRNGLWVFKDSGWYKVCELGLANPCKLKSQSVQGEGFIGYEVDVYRDGKSVGRHVLPADKFNSRASFQSWTMQWSCAMKASDIQTSTLANVLHNRCGKNGMNESWVIGTEGVTMVVPPNAKTADDFDIVWSSPTEVVSLNGNNYRFRSPMERDGIYKSDLTKAPDLSRDDTMLIANLLEINSRQNVAKLLGWFSAAFLTSIFRRYFHQFPILQVYGQAGAGKTGTVSTLNHLFYHLQMPKVLQATGQTNFPIIAAVSSSASMPAVFEEVKRREMNKSSIDFLMSMFRNNYNGNNISRGGLSRDTAAKDIVVNEYANQCPLVFVGEAIENQAAILERCVVVSLSKGDRIGRGDNFNAVEAVKTDLGKLGKALMRSALSLKVDLFRSRFAEIKLSLKQRLGAKADGVDRPIYNIAVVIMGLEFLKGTLQRTFENQFDETIDAMIESVAENISAHIPQNMAEDSRVLDVLSQLTRIDDVTYQLQIGRDYTVAVVEGAGGNYVNVDMKLKPCFAKYTKYVRSLGQDPLYDNDRAFLQAMRKYEGVIAEACPDNEVLFRDSFEPIFRFSGEYMANEGIETFGP